MDGNGRWAINQNQPRALGHKAGAQTAKKIINECVKKKIPFLTLYTFSNENWLRTKKKVDTLMKLLSLMLDKELDSMMRNNIRFNIVGRLEDLPKKTKEFVEQTINKTKNNSGLFLTLALSYGGRQEIIDAMNSILEKNIEDEKGNVTRFLIMGKKIEQPEFKKEKKFITSCIFRVKSEPSALYKCLGGFATNQVNLTKLESFSVKNSFDQANFYLDLEGHLEQPGVKKALEELSFHTETLDILGVYEASSFRQK